uniref:Secreted protein n=2 Tax=Opuntia streptacantha TaxID=393608 RepID=A0A7C9EA58_OPUST
MHLGLTACITSISFYWMFMAMMCDLHSSHLCAEVALPIVIGKAFQYPRNITNSCTHLASFILWITQPQAWLFVAKVCIPITITPSPNSTLNIQNLSNPTTSCHRILSYFSFIKSCIPGAPSNWF